MALTVLVQFDLIGVKSLSYVIHFDDSPSYKEIELSFVCGIVVYETIKHRHSCYIPQLSLLWMLVFKFGLCIHFKKGWLYRTKHFKSNQPELYLP